MDDLVKPLVMVRLDDVSRVGNKASVLAHLAHEGYPVPPGWCLTTDAFRLALGPYKEEIAALLVKVDRLNREDAEEAAEAITQLTAGMTVPPAVVAALTHHLASVTESGTPLAIRSSATDEDNPTSSYAGQYSSVLGVPGGSSNFVAILDAIVTCWRSYYSANALFARTKAGEPAGAGAMAVLIQPMVEAECAGVCYSVDPVQQRPGVIVVEATWGLGTGIADGSLASDTAWIQRDRLFVIRHRVAAKSEQIASNPSGGVHRVPVPEERQRSACLPKRWLRRLAQFAVAAEQLFGRPQDIEWAIDGEQIWLLQSRPIASLPLEMSPASRFVVEWPDSQDRRRAWEPYPLSGRKGQVLLPLEREYLAAIESMREETCHFMGADANGKLAFFNGRAYFCSLPLNMSGGDLRVRRAARLDLQNRLREQGLTSWDYWGPEVVKAIERLQAFDVETAGDTKLAEHLADALAVKRRHTMIHPMLWFKPDEVFFDAFAAVSGLDKPAAMETAYRLLDGEETTLTRIVDRLYDLAQIAGRSAKVTRLISDARPDTLARLSDLPAPDSAVAADLLVRLDEFLADYGERNGAGYGSEATIVTPTWREQPEQVLRLAGRYLDPDIPPPAVARVRARKEREAQIARWCHSCEDQEAVAAFRHHLAYARRSFAGLEEHNHTIDQLTTGLLRRAILAGGGRLVNKNVLADPEEVFWVTFGEIQAALKEAAPGSLEKTVVARRAEHDEWLRQEAPPILGVPKATLPERPPLTDNVAGKTDRPETEHLVTGLGASSGRYRGRARVVLDPTSLPDLLPGEVLVAENAGPLWTPFFPILGAIILDQGSLGQHAAATAREYGLPAVINTGDGSRRIPNGAVVTVDGTTGHVEIVLPPSGEARVSQDR